MAIPSKTNSLPLKPIPDESFWKAFLRIHKKENHSMNMNKKIKRANNSKTVAIIENDATVLIFEWIHDKYQIVAGKEEILFDNLLRDQDDDYLDTYLMNHSSFISSTQLLNRLIQSFYTSMHQSRILYIIQRWLLMHYYHFKRNQGLFEQLNSFLSKEYITINYNQQPKLYVQPNTYVSIDGRPILSIDSKSIARYLTLVDHFLFNYIISNELMYYGEGSKCDVIDLMTKRFNMLNYWVMNELCNIKSTKLKKASIEKFIEISKICFELNNFHTCMIITMSLASTSNKLKKIWRSLSHKDMNTFKLFNKLLNIDSNMHYYRQQLHVTKKRPVIPFLPVVLKDMTFLKESPITHLDMVNFSRCQSIKEYVEKHQKLIDKPYWFVHDLVHVPYVGSTHLDTQGLLDPIGDWVESRLNGIQEGYVCSSC
ncbi:hypothetical protein G6F47_000435 [Rhizopus delemar]|nr:hypothetical protein G6F48_002266 [Rhizopus delemar]KAG1604975.1 hypothetical protein G6F47_000435 [Rhizopus delemar]KAG1646792.1 hypothetical protein G6F44_000477 [Rhizopus delemar]